MNSKDSQSEALRLRKMAIALFSLAAVFSIVTYFLPHEESNYWFSSSGKEGFYVMSAFFVVLGCYCWGALLRR